MSKVLRFLTQSDFAFVWKSALYLILGSVWLAPSGHRIIPIGLIVGFVLVHFIESLRIDRRVEFGLLVVGAAFGLYGLGITINW
jgi:hypothetical protein